MESNYRTNKKREMLRNEILEIRIQKTAYKRDGAFTRSAVICDFILRMRFEIVDEINILGIIISLLK